MTDRIVVIGAGGFGRETLDVIDAAVSAGAKLELVGVIDSGPSEADLARLADRGITYLGTEDGWAPSATGDERYIVAIGNPHLREAAANRMAASGFQALSVIHPHATLGSKVTLGQGVVVCSAVQISTNVTIGDHVHLNPASVVGHDSQLRSFVSVNPGAILSGNVAVEEKALIGAGATVLQNLRIGAGAIVGAAACVTSHVSAASTVVGVPARPQS